MRIIRNLECPRISKPDHVYDVGSNKSAQFALGEVGSKEDFWLVGLPVEPSSVYPMISGNLIGDDGSTLIRIINSQITFNPRNCKRIFSNSLNGFNYKLKSPDGWTVLEVETSYTDASGYVTFIRGNFNDKSGLGLISITEDRIEMPEDISADVGGQTFGPQPTPTQIDYLNFSANPRITFRTILTCGPSSQG